MLVRTPRALAMLPGTPWLSAPCRSDLQHKEMCTENPPDSKLRFFFCWSLAAAVPDPPGQSAGMADMVLHGGHMESHACCTSTHSAA